MFCDVNNSRINKFKLIYYFNIKEIIHLQNIILNIGTSSLKILPENLNLGCLN